MLYCDAGAAMFRLDTTLRLNKTFALGAIAADPTLSHTKTFEFDGSFFLDFAETPGITNVVIRRTLMMHL
jgi:hypothetical protein